jgi:hypothetical protein
MPFLHQPSNIPSKNSNFSQTCHYKALEPIKLVSSENPKTQKPKNPITQKPIPKNPKTYRKTHKTQKPRRNGWVFGFLPSSDPKVVSQQNLIIQCIPIANHENQKVPTFSNLPNSSSPCISRQQQQSDVIYNMSDSTTHSRAIRRKISPEIQHQHKLEFQTQREN